MKIKKWYYLNRRYYPCLVDDVSLIDKKDVNRFPDKEEIVNVDDDRLPIIVEVYIDENKIKE